MVVYRCWFKFRNLIDCYDNHSVVTSEEGVSAFKDGFWVTDRMKLTKGEDCKYWIPPSQIILIEKGVMP